MKKLYSEEGIIHYYGNMAGYIDGNKMIIDPLFDKKEIRELAAQMEVVVEVVEGTYKNLTEGKIASEVTKVLSLKIFQLNKDSPLEERFISLSKREERGFIKPNRAEYDQIYEGEVEKFDLEDIWERFARCVPRDFGGHALSISDIVELSDGENIRCFYLEPSGFTEIEF